MSIKGYYNDTTPRSSFNWRPPATLRAELAAKAKENGRSLNAELTQAVREYLREKYR